MFKNFIAGEWVDGARSSRNINPSDTSDVVGEYAQADAAQTRAAIDAARMAFPAWSLSDDHAWPREFRQYIAIYHPQIVIGTWSWDDIEASGSPVGSASLRSGP